MSDRKRVRLIVEFDVDGFRKANDWQRWLLDEMNSKVGGYCPTVVIDRVLGGTEPYDLARQAREEQPNNRIGQVRAYRALMEIHHGFRPGMKDAYDSHLPHGADAMAPVVMSRFTEPENLYGGLTTQGGQVPQAIPLDDEPNPIENGVQRVYTDIRESLDLILLAETTLPQDVIRRVLNSLDDAISNNWDDVMLAFWRGVGQDIDKLGGD